MIFIPDKKFKFYALAMNGINCVFINTENSKKILILGYDRNKEIAGIRNVLIPFLRYKGINNIDFLILYSVINKKNITAIADNFLIKKIIADFEIEKFKNYSLVGVNEILDKNTKIFVKSSETEVEFKGKNIIFQKILKENKDDYYIIYACFYDFETLKKNSLKSKCIINSKNRKIFQKQKFGEIENVYDVGNKGIFVLDL